MRIEDIANGMEFDLVRAIRVLAQGLVDTRALILMAESDGNPVSGVADDPLPASPNPLPASPGAGEGKPGEGNAVLNNRLAGLLAQHGFTSLDAIKAASDQQLLDIAGVGDKVLQMIREKVG